MKHTALLSVIFYCAIPSLIFCQNVYHVYFNEVRPDDAGTDDAEYAELIGSAGTVITGFKIIHYNGSDTQDGGIWTHTISTFIIPDDGVTDANGTALGFYVYGHSIVPFVDEVLAPSNDIQNGPDGMVLYDATGNILDAIAWGGPGDMTTDDPGTVTTSGSTSANNYLHVTALDDNADNSLSAPDNVVGDDGTGWLIVAATPGAINTNQSSGSVMLPIELIYFESKVKEQSIYLQWATAHEESNSYFSIERKNRMFAFQELGRIEGQGTTYETHNYTFTDPHPAPGANYYRLKQVDYDGRFSYSPVVSVNWGGEDGFRIFPSPVVSNLHVAFPQNWEDAEDIIVFDLLGQVRKRWHLDGTAQEVELDVSGLPRGIFVMEAVSGSRRVVNRFEKI